MQGALAALGPGLALQPAFAYAGHACPCSVTVSLETWGLSSMEWNFSLPIIPFHRLEEADTKVRNPCLEDCPLVTVSCPEPPLRDPSASLHSVWTAGQWVLSGHL